MSGLLREQKLFQYKQHLLLDFLTYVEEIRSPEPVGHNVRLETQCGNDAPVIENLLRCLKLAHQVTG